jgi:hypothetical protein
MNWTRLPNGLIPQRLLPRSDAVQVVFGNIPAFNVGFKTGGAAVQLAFFLGTCAADWTHEIERNVDIWHVELLQLLHQ